MSLGYHVNKGDAPRTEFSKTIIAASDSVAGMGFQPCLQIFVKGPRGTADILTENDKRVLAAWRGRIVIHGAYLDIPWGEKPVSVHNIKAEMILSDVIGATGVVVHLGKNALDSMHRVLGAINDMPPLNSRLWLENKPNKTGKTFDTAAEVKMLFDCIDAAPSKPKIGFCVDTQHAFASGRDLRTYQPTYAWLTELRQAIPAEYPMMIHLNDSATAMGSGIDQHACLGKGVIWKGYGMNPGDNDPMQSGCAAVLMWAEQNNADVILETKDSAHDLAYVKDIGILLKK